MRLAFCACVLTFFSLTTWSKAGHALDTPSSGSARVSAAATDSALRVDTALAFGTVRVPIALPVPASKTGTLQSIVLQYDEAAPDGSVVGALWRLDLPSIVATDDAQGSGLSLVRGSATTRLVVVGPDLVEQVGSGGVRFVSRVDAAGATYYERVDEDGVRFTYGRTAASRDTVANQVDRWLLDTIQDASGNRIALAYGSQSAPEAKRLERIEYDQHDAIGGGPLRLSFQYVARPLVTSDVVRGHSWRSSERLVEISLESRPTPFATAWKSEWRYQLTYRDAADPKSTGGFSQNGLLTTIDQIVGSNRRNLYTFAYEGGGIATASRRYEIGVASQVQDNQLIFSDLFQPGTRKPLRIEGNLLASGNDDELRLLPSDSTFVSDAKSLLNWTTPRQTVLCALGVNALFCARAMSTERLPHPQERRIVPSWSNPAYGDATFRSSMRLGDVNGDAKVDACASNGTNIECVLDLLGGSTPSVWGTLTGGPADTDGWKSWQLIDVNADRRADICWLTSTSVRCAITGISLGSSGQFETPFALDRASQLSTFSFVSLNADEYPDFCGRLGDRLSCRFGNGRGFVDPGYSLDLSGRPVGDARFAYSVVFLQLNLDGLTDVCLLQSSAAFSCHLAMANGFSGSVGGPEWNGPLPGTGGSRETLYFQPEPPRTIKSGGQHVVNPLYRAWSQLLSSPTANDTNGDGADELCVRVNASVFDCWDPMAARRLHLQRLTLETGASEVLAWEVSSAGNHARLHRDVIVRRSVHDVDGSERRHSSFAYANGHYAEPSGEFRGYRRVAETRYAGTAAETHYVYEFYQGDEASVDAEIASLSGALNLVQTNEGGFRALALYYSDSTAPGSAFRRPQLRRVTKQWCDGKGCDPVIAIRPGRRVLESDRTSLTPPPWPVDPPRWKWTPADRLVISPLIDFRSVAPKKWGKISALTKSVPSNDILLNTELKGFGWNLTHVPAVTVPEWVDTTPLAPIALCRPDSPKKPCGFAITVHTSKDSLEFDLLGLANAPLHWYSLFRSSYSEFDYDGIGNVTEERHAWYAHTGAAKRRIRREYAPGTGGAPVNRMSRERVFIDDQPSPVSEVRYRFDSIDTVTDPSDCSSAQVATTAVLNRGLPTQRIQWQDGPDNARINSEERWAYDQRGNVSCAWSAGGALTRFTYAHFRWLAERQDNALGHVGLRRFNGLGANPGVGRFALPAEVVVPSGARVRLDYDDFGLLTRTSYRDNTGTEKAWETIAYSPATGTTPARTVFKNSDGSDLRVDTNAFAEATELAWHDQDGSWRSQLRRYDVAGRLAAESDRALAGTPSAQRRWSTVEYDNAGRPSHMRPLSEPETTVCRFQHVVVTTRGKDHVAVIEQSPFETLYAMHRVAKLMPEKGISFFPKKKPQMDALKDNPAFSGAIEQDLPIPCLGRYAARQDVYTHRYEYDGMGRVVSIHAPADRTIAIGFAPNGRVSTVDDPDVGRAFWAWGSDAELSTATSADGTVVTFQRDVLGRIIRSAPEGSNPADWREFTYDVGCSACAGRLTQTRTPTVIVNRAFDAFGTLTSESSTFAGVTRQVSFKRSPLGLLASLTYPDGSVAGYGYAYGRLASISYNQFPVLSPPTLDAHGHVTALPLGNRLVLRYAFHGDDTRCPAAHGQLCRMETATRVNPGSPTTVLQELRWTYDADVLPEEIVDVLAGSVRYDYDVFGRLTNEVRSDGTNTFTYTQAGGIDRDALQGARQYDSQRATRLLATSEVQLGYDSAGRVNELLGPGSRRQTVEYSAFNAPRRIETKNGDGAQHVFTLLTDAQGVVRGYQSDGSTIRLDLGQVCLDADCRNQIEVDGRQLANAIAGSTTANVDTWIVSEPNGTVRLVLDAQGNPIARPRHAAFGVGLANASLAAIPKSWMGHLSVLADMKLIGARLYVPALATFLQPDTAITDAQSSWPHNRYIYASQNPIAFTDVGGFQTSKSTEVVSRTTISRAQAGVRVWGGIGSIAGGIAVSVAVAGSVTAGAAVAACAAAGLVAVGTMAVTVGAVGLVTGQSFGMIDTVADIGTAISISPAGTLNGVASIIGITSAVVSNADSVDAATKTGVAVTAAGRGTGEAVADFLDSPGKMNGVGIGVALVDLAASAAEAMNSEAERRAEAASRDHAGRLHDGDFNFGAEPNDSGSSSPDLPDTHDFPDPPDVDTNEPIDADPVEPHPVDLNDNDTQPSIPIPLH